MVELTSYNKCQFGQIYIEKRQVDGNIYHTLLLKIGKNANVNSTNSIGDLLSVKFGGNQSTTKGFWSPISRSYSSISGRLQNWLTRHYIKKVRWKLLTVLIVIQDW